jgi:hypothetical protein
MHLADPRLKGFILHLSACGTADLSRFLFHGPNYRTSKEPYPDHLIAMAAHGQLWQETHPQHPVTAGYHLT